MGSLAQRLDDIHLRVQVPGADIRAELRRRTDVTISFGPQVYPWLDDRGLERHMATLARLLYIAWVRHYHAALGDAFRRPDDPDDQTERDYLTARGDLVSHGACADGRITIAARGMRQVSVRITDGTARTLTEREFVDHTRQAVSALTRDHMTKIRALKLRFFG